MSYKPKNHLAYFLFLSRFFIFLCFLKIFLCFLIYQYMLLLIFLPDIFIILLYAKYYVRHASKMMNEHVCIFIYIYIYVYVLQYVYINMFMYTCRHACICWHGLYTIHILLSKIYKGKDCKGMV